MVQKNVMKLANISGAFLPPDFPFKFQHSNRKLILFLRTESGVVTYYNVHCTGIPSTHKHPKKPLWTIAEEWIVLSKQICMSVKFFTMVNTTLPCNL